MAGRRPQRATGGKKGAPGSPQSISGQKDTREPLARTRSSSPTRTATTLPTDTAHTSTFTKQIQDREYQIRELERRNDLLQKDHDNNAYAKMRLDNHDRLDKWTLYLPAKWLEEIWPIFTSLDRLARNYIRRDTKTLSPEQKRDLIASLDGFCVQDDFDVIAAGLPKALRSIFLQSLVGTFLVKECILKFLMNPFWYLSHRPSSDTGEEKPPINTPGFGDQILTLYRTMLDSNPSDAHLWRLWTTRFCNADNEIGNNMAAHRRSMADKICEEVFSQDLLQSLLSNSDEEAQHIALEQLKDKFKSAADFSVRVSCQLPYMEFETLKIINPYFYHSSTETKLGIRHGLGSSKHRLDGHRILYLESPAIYICGGAHDFCEKRLGQQAIVYADDQENPRSS